MSGAIMMNLNFKEIDEYLLRRLRLRTTPVAVKLLDKLEDIPPEAEIPAFPIDMCILSSIARFHAKIVVARVEDVACAYGSCNTGFSEYDEKAIVDRYWNMLFRKAVPYENLKNLFTMVPRVGFGTRAVMMAPLPRTPVDPDLVMIVGNSLQMMVLINSYVLESGIGRLHFSAGGSQGICGDSIAATISSPQPQIAFPCNGARIYGLYADDEVVFSCQTRNLPVLVEGLKKTEAKLPIPVQLNLGEFRVGIISDFMTKKRN